MKRFTILFLVLALIVVAVVPAMAAKGVTKQKGNPKNLQVSEVTEDAAIRAEMDRQDAVFKLEKAIGQKPRTQQATALAGLYSIGTLAPGGYVANYLTLTDAVIALQTGGVSGPTTFEFTDASYSDSGQTIGGYAGQGAANPVIFRPKSPATPTITFTGGSVGNIFGIRFDSASYMTWTGNSGIHGTRPLYIKSDTATGQPARNQIVIRRSNHVTLSDMIVDGHRRYVGLAGFSTILETGSSMVTPNTDISYDNLLVRRGSTGIAAFGIGAAPSFGPFDQNISITRCDFGDPSDLILKITSTALTFGIIDGMTVSDNDFRHVAQYPNNTGVLTVAGVTSISTIKNVTISRNKIHNIDRNGTGSINGKGAAVGLRVIASGATAVLQNVLVTNNMIYDLRNTNGVNTSATQAMEGMRPGSQSGGVMVGGNGLYIYNNTIHLTGTLSATTPSYAPAILHSTGNATDTAHLVDNVISAPLATPNNGGNYAYADFTDPRGSDYNLYWTPGTAGGMSIFNGTTLNDWQTALLIDLNSIYGDPMCVSDTDPHIDVTVGVVSPADDAGTPLALKTDDIDGDPRDPVNPDIGADEFEGVPFPDEAFPIAVVFPTTGGVPANKAGIFPHVKIRNNGSNTNNIPVRLKITGTGGDEYEQVEVAQAVPPLSFFDVFFTTQWLPTGAIEVKSVRATTELAGDNDTSNDTLNTTTRIVQKITSLPYATTFEDGGEAGWYSGGGDWVLGTPAKVGINHAWSAPNSWVTKLTGNYSDAQDASVYSPYFDLTNSAYPIIKFRNKFQTEGTWDGGAIEYTLDFGATWQLLGALNDPKGYFWYNDNGVNLPWPAWSGSNFLAFSDTDYVHSQLYAKGVGGQSQVQFRFRFHSDGNTPDEGWAFDDFAINDAPSISGKVYNDANNSQSYNGGEPVFVGAEVYLDDGVHPIDTVLTDANGDYVVTNAFEGTYNISTNVTFGVPTVPVGGIYIGAVVVKNVPFVADFGYYGPASISGHIWDDVNHNQSDDGEPDMAGITVTLNPGAVQTTTDSNGDYEFVVNDPGSYTVAQTVPAGYVELYPKTPYGPINVTYLGTNPGYDWGNAAAATVNSYRTATMSQWATAIDNKGKLKAIKCKAYEVDFKYNIVAPDSALLTSITSVEVKLGMVSSGVMYHGKAKAETVAVFSGVKVFTYTAAIAQGDTFQIDGRGSKGKAVKPSFKWFGTLGVKAKKVSGKVTEFKANIPRLRMPNLHNVGAELEAQTAFPIVIGASSGASSVSHAKYKDAQKSLNTKGVLHTGPASCLGQFANSKPILKQQKSLPNTKHNNILFAEALTLALNLKASANGKFPAGLGSLIYDNHKDGLDTSSPFFNGKTIDQILVQVNGFLNCIDTPKVGADANDYLAVVQNINNAFAPDSGQIDTVSWSCGKLSLTGVRDLKDVVYLRALPGAIQPITQPGDGSTAYLVPDKYALHQNYPNPFNPTTNIQFDLPEAGIVNIRIYNMLGQEVATLLDNELMDDGIQEVEFDANTLPSGVYFYRLTVQSVDDEGVVLGNSFTQVKKMMLVK